MTDYSKLPSLFAPQVTATVGGRDIATGARVERRPTATHEEPKTMSDPIDPQHFLAVIAERDAARAELAKRTADAERERLKSELRAELEAERNGPPPAAAPAQPAASGPPSAEALTAYARAISHGRGTPAYVATLQQAGLDPNDPFGVLTRAAAARDAARRRGGL